MSATMREGSAADLYERDWAITQAYQLALIEAERETGLPESTFPVTCPFTFGQMLDDAFWP